MSAPAPVDPVVGAHARPPARRTVLLLALALTGLAMAVGTAAKAPCALGAWWAASEGHARLCATSLATDYTGLGLVEGQRPLTEGRRETSGATPTVAVVSWATGAVSRSLSGAPAPAERDDRPVAEVDASDQVRAETVAYVAVAAVLLAGLALLAAGCLVALCGPRPRDALWFATAPVLVLSGLLGWDLLAVALMCAGLLAWARDRPLLSGLLLGVAATVTAWPLLVAIGLLVVAVRAGWAERALPMAAGALGGWVAVMLPAYVLAPQGWSRWLTERAAQPVGTGSTWNVVEGYGFDPGPGTVLGVLALGLLVALAGVGWLIASAPRRPRVAQVCLLLVAAAVLLSPTATPQTALWVLPLAVLARPAGRDLAVWQSCEVVFWLACAWHLGGFTLGGGTASLDEVYLLAILLRIFGLGWLAVAVVRDVRSPWRDPVRSDGRLDDPAGGVLDGALDRAPDRTPGPARSPRPAGRA